MGKEERTPSNEELIMATFFLPWTHDFVKLKLKVKNVEEYLDEIINSSVEPSLEEFVFEGVKRGLIPVLYSLIVEKLGKYIESHKNSEESTLVSITILLLSKRIPPEKIPFFQGLFIKTALNTPYAENPKIWKLLYPFLPKKVEKTEKSGIIAPDNLGREGEDSENYIIITDRSKGKNKEEKKVIITDD